MERGDNVKEGNVEDENVTTFEVPCCSKSVKRQRLEGSEPSEPESVEQSELTSDGDDCPVQKALRNELILQKIFENLDNENLLSSCSLVNKTWNAEAGKFVRTYRKCMTQTRSYTTPCEFLHQLDLLCGQMKDSGRVVPFNCLQLNFNKRCEKNDDEILYSNIISELKIKGLVITSSTLGSEFPDCEHHRPLLTVFKHKGTELRSLKVDRTGPFSRYIADKWCPQFHQLEEFSVDNFMGSETLKVETSRLRWLLKDTPSLNRIVSTRLDLLKIVPPKILARMAYHGTLAIIRKLPALELNLLCAVADKASGLTKLVFREPARKPFEGKKGSKYKSALERLLQAVQQSLASLSTNAGYPLSQISHPPLVNLSILNLALRNDQDWNDFALIDFERLMPRLEIVGISVETKVKCDGLLYSSTTVRELDLQLKNCGFNLGILGAALPNLSVLNLHLKDNWPRRRRGGDRLWHSAPVLKICANLPQLEELRIAGHVSCNRRNYDEEFCGIEYEEAAWLWEQDDDYLKKVNIVPSRPCLLTMPKLHIFFFVQEIVEDV